MERSDGVVTTAFRLLTFRISRERLLKLNRNNLLFGLICTWLVGMGRYWDDPGANLLQHLGLGSVIYIFLLSFLLWLLILPLRPKAWSYFGVLTFVSLTSPPAVLYAIPVEGFFSLETARSLNVWFLAIVATWRVSLLIFFLNRYAMLRPFEIVIASLLPLTIIVTALTALNLERAVFELMSGERARKGAANDSAYAVLWLISVFSVVLFIPLLLCYVGLVWNRLIEDRAAKRGATRVDRPTAD